MAKIKCVITYFIGLLAGLFKHLLTAIGLKDPIPILCGDKIILQLQTTLTMFNGLTQKPRRSWCSSTILEVLATAKLAMKAGMVVATRPNRNSDGRWAPWCLMQGEWAWAKREWDFCVVFEFVYVHKFGWNWSRTWSEESKILKAVVRFIRFLSEIRRQTWE